MPSSTKTPRGRATRATVKSRAGVGRSRALMVIDHERLQGAAWAEFHTARKRLDRVARDLHRHEEVDVPEFTAWLHRMYPHDVTTLRELRDEVASKTRQIRAVQMMAATTGGSLKRIWREQKQSGGNPKKFRAKPRAAHAPDEDEGAESSARRTDARDEDFASAPVPPRTVVARDIYRRLVQHLHPDRGGEWSMRRQRLWHEVQQAWAVGDSDWLARLEVEWETAHEVVGPHSPLSRLRAAIDEIHAARRDAEAKLRDYRSSPQWRFSSSEATRRALERRVEANFNRDFTFFRRQLNYLNTTIAAWEEDWTRADTRANPRRGRRTYHYRARRPGTAESGA